MRWINTPTKFTDEVLKDADNLSKRVAGEVLQKVVTQNPVDTGLSRGNWRTSVGVIDGTTDSTLLDKSGQGSISRGIATIQSGGGVGRLVYIANSLPYIVRLNNGYSMQAPANFVDLSVQSVVNKYK